jgi:hypothetical protein
VAKVEGGTGEVGSGEPGPAQIVLIRAKRIFAARELMRRRRRPLIAIGAPAQEPIQQTTIPQVTMRHDPWKGWVRCATTANVVLATALEAGDTIDGIVLALNDRVLVWKQTDAKENGIYTVNQTGAPTRAADASVGDHLVHAVVGVERGTANGDKFFVCYTNSPIIIGSTNIAWASLSNFIGAIDGGQIITGSVDISVLFGSGLTSGSLIQCDGSGWILIEPTTEGQVLYFNGAIWKTLDPPGVKSRLTHDGGGGDPYWDPV